MKLIAHRGNTDGPNPLEENKLEYIESAIDKGFDVEIDVRYDSSESKFYLGHDYPQYTIDWDWFIKYSDKLWIHCKDIGSLYQFNLASNSFIPPALNYFWHQDDQFTLTSKNYIWTYPGHKHTPDSIVVMPELIYKNITQAKNLNCYAICSDFVGDLV